MSLHLVILNAFLVIVSVLSVILSGAKDPFTVKSHGDPDVEDVSLRST